MNLYLKHVRRSIKTSPLEPLLIILTLAISIAALIIAVAVATTMGKEQKHLRNDNNLVGDITVKCSSSDNVRLLFEKDVSDIVGERGVVLGQFTLGAAVKNEKPKSTDKKNSKNDKEDKKEEIRRIEICATDLVAADRFRKMKFIEYGGFDEKNLNSSVIIHNKLAEEYGLSVGDTLSVEILGKPFDLRVGAVVLKDGVFWRHEAMIDMGAVRGAIAEENPIVSALADNLNPYTLINVEVFDDTEIKTIISELEADDRFKDKIIVNMSENVGGVEFYTILTLTATIALSCFVILLSSAVIATSLSLFERKRQRETALFMISGADRGTLRRFLLTECGVYSLLSILPGCLLSLPAISFVNTIFHFNVGAIEFDLYSVLVAAVGAPLLLMSVALIRSARAKEVTVSELLSEGEGEAVRASVNKTVIILGLVLLLFVSVTLCLPVRLRYIGVIPSVLLLTIFAYFVTPTVTRGISALFLRLLKRLKVIPARIYLTARNVFASYPLMHTARLLSVLLCIMGGMFLITETLWQQTNVINGIVDCDYIAPDADERCEEKVLSEEAAKDTFRMAFFNQIICEDGSVIFAVSLDEADRERLSEQIRPARMPEGDEIILPIGVALYEGVEVGDKISFNYETNDYTVTVIEIINTTPNVAFIDESVIGARKNLLCIDTAVADDEVEWTLDEIMKLRGVELVSRVEMFRAYTVIVEAYARLLAFITAIAAFTTLIGIFNIIHSAQLERVNESRICYVVGMTEREIRGLRIWEHIAAFALALLITIPFFFGFAALIDMAVNSFGVDLLH